LIKTVKGERHISKLIDKMAFGSYNKRFGGGSKEDPNPWLTCDEEVRKRYYADKYCTFKFTVSAMGDLIELIDITNAGAWYEALPKMPILLVSGADDPVGNYGKGVNTVFGKLKKHGFDAVSILYDGARHEILNDFTYEQVKNDILKFAYN
jgi:alpha-beta hydrolase superfamily lysophospholipase